MDSVLWRDALFGFEPPAAPTSPTLCMAGAAPSGLDGTWRPASTRHLVSAHARRALAAAGLVVKRWPAHLRPGAGSWPAGAASSADLKGPIYCRGKSLAIGCSPSFNRGVAAGCPPVRWCCGRSRAGDLGTKPQLLIDPARPLAPERAPWLVDAPCWPQRRSTAAPMWCDRWRTGCGATLLSGLKRYSQQQQSQADVTWPMTAASSGACSGGSWGWQPPATSGNCLAALPREEPCFTRAFQ